MSTVTVEIDRELVGLLYPVHGRPEDTLKEYLVLELYRRREISSGKAAELLSMERFEFVRYASRMGVPFFDMDQRELEEEVARAEVRHDCPWVRCQFESVHCYGHGNSGNLADSR